MLLPWPRNVSPGRDRSEWSRGHWPSLVRSSRPTDTAANETGRPGRRRAVRQPSPCATGPGLHPHLRVRLQVADVISLRAVRGHQPESVTGEAVADGGAPADTGAAAGGLQQRESPRRETMQQQESPHPVAGPLNRGDRSVLARAHSPVLPVRGQWRYLGRGRACVSGSDRATEPTARDQLGRSVVQHRA